MRLFRAKFAIVGAALACMPLFTAASAETIITKKYSYFSIGGLTAADLDREMLQHGPVSKVTGKRHPGVTQIKFNGSATFAGKNGRCYIGGAKVTLSTKILLPRWTNRRKASARLGLVWDTLAADIRRHEERHAEIARNHARDLEKRILALGSSSDCDSLKTKVNLVSQEAMLEHEKDQQRFDRIESINFENRMIRLLKYRIASKKAI